jgi:hypothetical protein
LPRKDPEARAQYCREYRARYKEYFKEYNRQYRLDHLEELRAYDKKRRLGTNRDRFGRLVSGRILGMCEKATPKATKSPTLCDIAWAAGFIEGEGYFAPNGASSQAGVNQVQREPLDRLQAMFGGSVRVYHNDRHNERWQPQWRWAVAGSRARGVMMTLYPMMSPRRKEQIRAALSGQSRAGAVA